MRKIVKQLASAPAKNKHMEYNSIFLRGIY